MKTIFIRVVIFNAVTKKIEVQCVSPAQNDLGILFIPKMVTLDEPGLPENWTKNDVFDAVVQKLNVNPELMGWATDLQDQQLAALITQTIINISRSS